MKFLLLSLCVLINSAESTDSKPNLRSLPNNEDIVPSNDSPIKQQDLKEISTDPRNGPLNHRGLSSEGRCGPDFGNSTCTCAYDDHYCSHWGWCGFTPQFVKYEGFDGQFNCANPVVMTEIDGVRCWTGSAAAVTNSCEEYKADCCTGVGACSNWAGENTVCTGSCKGLDSCRGIGTDNVILTGSCTWDQACYSGITDGTIVNKQERLGVVVEEIDDAMCFTGSDVDVTRACELYGANCCSSAHPDGFQATDLACMNWRGINTVCEGSCLGLESCNTLSSFTTVLSGSCDGDYSCKDLGGNNGHAEVKKQIGPRSCTGRSSCSDLGTNISPDSSALCAGESFGILIEPDSCNGTGACYNLGHLAKWVRVSESSCQGFVACGWETSDSRCNNTQTAYIAPSTCHTEYDECKQVIWDSCGDERPAGCTDTCLEMIDAKQHCKDNCAI